jgi:chaperonin GroES
LIFHEATLLFALSEDRSFVFVQPIRFAQTVGQQTPLSANKFFVRLLKKKTGGVSMKIRPLNDRILVKRLEGEEKTAGGIIIPDSAKEKPAEGEVVAIGPGKLNEAGERVAMDVAVGDRVLFSKYGGTEVKLDGEDFLIMREDDILGVIQA